MINELHKLTKSQWMIASVVFNTVLAGFKIFWSIYSNSSVMYADAVHSTADVLGALLIYLAIRFSKTKSKKFPYGLHKLENIAALVGGVVVLFAGYEIVRSVFLEEKASAVDKSIETIIFMIVITAVTLVFYYFEQKAAKRLNSPGVEADAANWLGDMATNFVVIIGTLGVLFKIPHIEQIAVVFIVILVFKSAFEIIKNSLLALLDASANIKLSDKIRSIISSYQKESKIQFLKITPAGSVYYVTASIELNEKSLKEAHQLADMISKDIKDKVENIEEVIIHFEPVKKDYERYAYLFEDDKKTPSKNFGKTPWILLVDKDDNGEIVNKEFVYNFNRDSKKGKGIRLISLLIQKDINFLIDENINKENSLKLILEEVGIEIKNDKKVPNTDVI